MNVQVNVKSAAKRIKQFVKAHGGSAMHSEVLELVAGVCGFDSYRAMKAVSPQSEYKGPILGQIRSTTSGIADTARGRQLEDPSRVVFRSTAVDWKLADNPEISFEELPAAHRRKYDVVVEHCGDQFRILMKPEGVDIDNFDGQPVLDMLLEINEGVPCAHLTNDPADAMLVSVFANEKGLIVRPDDGEWLRADNDGVPASLRAAAIETCSEKALHKAYVAVSDTKEKYASDPIMPVTPASALQVHAPKSYPWAQTYVTNPVNRRHVGNLVKVSFNDRVATEGKRLWLDLDLHDAEGVIGDYDHIGCFSSFTVESPQSELRDFADCMAQVIAYFIGAGWSMEVLELIVYKIAESQSRVSTAKSCLESVQTADNAENAYIAILSISQIYN